MIHARSPKFFGILWILLALMSSASRCFRDPCEGKWSDASSFDVRGVEWVGNKAGVLGVFTKREKCPNLLGYTYQTLYSRDVMFFVDPSTIHQDENGWWIVEADSVWIIHQEPSIENGIDLWKDPADGTWWIVGWNGGIYHYDASFDQIRETIPGCGNISFRGDTLYYACHGDTTRREILFVRRIRGNQPETLFVRNVVSLATLGLMSGGPGGKVYFTWGEQLLRWEGADSFTVIDSPVVSFGLKNDTLVTWGLPGIDSVIYLRDPHTFSILDSLRLQGFVSGILLGNCVSTWRFHNDMAFSCPPPESQVLFCKKNSGGMLCTNELAIPFALFP